MDVSDTLALGIIAAVGGGLKWWMSTHITRFDAHTKECDEDRAELREELETYIDKTARIETVLGVTLQCPHETCPNKAILKSTQRHTIHPQKPPSASN